MLRNVLFARLDDQTLLLQKRDGASHGLIADAVLGRELGEHRQLAARPLLLIGGSRWARPIRCPRRCRQSRGRTWRRSETAARCWATGCRPHSSCPGSPTSGSPTATSSSPTTFLRLHVLPGQCRLRLGPADGMAPGQRPLRRPGLPPLRLVPITVHHRAGRRIQLRARRRERLRADRGLERVHLHRDGRPVLPPRALWAVDDDQPCSRAMPTTNTVQPETNT